jgi:hypothetical protein
MIAASFATVARSSPWSLGGEPLTTRGVALDLYRHFEHKPMRLFRTTELPE